MREEVKDHIRDILECWVFEYESWDVFCEEHDIDNFDEIEPIINELMRSCKIVFSE